MHAVMQYVIQQQRYRYCTAAVEDLYDSYLPAAASVEGLLQQYSTSRAAGSSSLLLQPTAQQLAALGNNYDPFGSPCQWISDLARGLRVPPPLGKRRITIK